MKFIYEHNGLPFFSERDIFLKDYLVKTISSEIKDILIGQNQAWKFIQIESPCLIPRNLINKNYTNDDLYVQENLNNSELVLKPETTPATFEYLKDVLVHSNLQLPICAWQVSKSFRREQDQPTKHCRYKEFYQQEFQCLFSADTKNDYQSNTIEDIANMFLRLLRLPTRIVYSDRLPSYSIKTIDVEVFNGDKWMEICSVSLRTDFDYEPMFKGKPAKCNVLEIAIGVDRLIYNINNHTSMGYTVENNLTKEAE